MVSGLLNYFYVLSPFKIFIFSQGLHIAISKNSVRMVNRGIVPDLTESFVFNALWPHTLLVSGCFGFDWSWGEGVDCHLTVFEKNICRGSINSFTELHHHHF